MFSVKHDALTAKISAQKKGSSEVPPLPATGAGTASPARKDASEFSAEKSAAMLQLTKSRSQDQKALATFDKRVDDQTQLAGVYGKWIDIVAAKQRAVLNDALRGIAIILVIALIGLFFDGWIESLLGKMTMDRRQVETLRTVTRCRTFCAASPVRAEFVEQDRTEHHIPVLATLAALYVNHHPLAIDVGDLQVSQLSVANSAAVKRHQ